MPIKEKKKRNIKIYKEKLGLPPFKRPKTYRELLKKYNLSFTTLIRIVNREKKKEEEKWK